MVQPLIFEIIFDIIVVISKPVYPMLRIIIGKSYCAVMVVIPIFDCAFFVFSPYYMIHKVKVIQNCTKQHRFMRSEMTGGVRVGYYH